MQMLHEIWIYKCPTLYKTERLFTTWYQSKISKYWFIYKMSDESRGHKPFDCFAMIHWFWVAIELKITKYKSCKPYLLLRWSSPGKPWTQVASLKKREECWWTSLVVVYSSATKNFAVINFKDLTPNTVVSLWDENI